MQRSTPDRTAEAVERPIRFENGAQFGSDVVAEMLRRLDVKFVALNPGASFRGLHDSLVNYLGNKNPQMLLCLHEENAVALAHGYAKASGEPLAVVLHSNVGLMHGSMAVFNAWCDRVPMLILGATGPVDAASRRPWIDWLHTARDQGALIRHFIKWDDQPASIDATIESLLRANLLTRTPPMGPVYVNIDATLQEQKIVDAPVLPDVARFQPPRQPAPSPESVGDVAKLLKSAKSPVFLAGRVSRSPRDWARRVALAEALDARVLTDFKVAAAFPTDHRLHRSKPSFFLDAAGAQTLRDADVIVSLDWLDLAGTMKQASGASGQVVQISLDYQLHNGWGMEHQGLPAADYSLALDPDVAVHTIADSLGVGAGEPPGDMPVVPAVPTPAADAPLDMSTLAGALGDGLNGICACLVRLPLGWAGENWHFRHPLDFLGFDGGAGIGSGPGMLVGAALALRDTNRLAVGVLGDGDFLMASSALWTAAHYGLPFIAVICNNRSFYNDEVHQERVAVARNRPVENKWIGQNIGNPDIDLAQIARAMGLEGFGPASTAGELAGYVKQAVALARAGKGVVIDARVEPGYNKAMVAGLTRSGG